MDRRHFLQLAASAAAGAALRPGLALAADSTVLTPGDLQYQGLFKLPIDDPTGARTRFGYSLGAMAIRRVAGELRIFITGSNGTAGGGDYNRFSDAVYEVAYPGVGSIDDAPRASFVRNWGDIYGGRRLLRDTNQSPMTRGLLYDQGRLWWGYGSQYFTGFDPDPSIGVSILNESNGTTSKFGPWRTQEHSQRTRGYWAMLPTDFASANTGGRRLAIGAPVTSGNAAGPRGSVLYALDNFDPTRLPPDTAGYTNGTIPYSLGTQRLVHHDLQNPQERNANYKICGWNVLYDYAQGAWIKPGEPNFNNDGLALDYFSACAWVQTPTKAGLVYFGSMTDLVPGTNYAGDTLPHMWYGPNNMKCCHGQTGLTWGTGPQSPTQVPIMAIYNPADVAMAAQGLINPWGFAPTAFRQLNTIAPSGIRPLISAPYQYSGAAFDPVDGLLLLVETDRDIVGEPRPVVHVFKVGDGTGAPSAPSNLRITTTP